MAYKFRRKVLSQNFIYNRSLIKQLVRGSSIGSQDTVLEIGPGKGFITSELLAMAKRVIAVELDFKLVLHLDKLFGDNPKLDLYAENFLEFHLPKTHYKVFANVPFSIEGKIIRKLLESINPPDDIYIVVRKDLAERLSGLTGNNAFAMQYQPWFDFTIYHQFNKSDFIPQPSMECVMWRITKKTTPLIPFNQQASYQKFIEKGFGNGLPVKRNIRKIISSSQLHQLSGKIGFSLDINPSKLSLQQWIKIYNLLQFPG